MLVACGDGNGDDGAGGIADTAGGVSTGPFGTAGGDVGVSGQTEGGAFGSFDDGAFDEGTFDGETEGNLPSGEVAGIPLLPTILNHVAGEPFDQAWLCDSNGTASEYGQRVGYLFQEEYNETTGYRIGRGLLERTRIVVDGTGYTLRGDADYANWIETGPDSLSIPIAIGAHDIADIVFQDRDHWTGNTTSEVFGQVSCERSAFDYDTFVGE